MKEYYVEVSNPPFPNKGRKIRMFKGVLNRDTLSSTLVALYKVKAEDREDALALALLGKGTRVMG